VCSFDFDLRSEIYMERALVWGWSFVSSFYPFFPLHPAYNSLLLMSGCPKYRSSVPGGFKAKYSLIGFPQWKVFY
jgi:hypothetical protein